jgi:beta-lactamase class A
MKGTLVFLLLAGVLSAATSADWAVRLDRTVRAVQTEFSAPQLKPTQLAITVIDLRQPQVPLRVDYRGAERFYPASVIKLFFLAYTHHLLAAGRLVDSPELRRGLRDMIVESFNEATSYIVDVITKTTSGPEMTAADLVVWSQKRGAVTQYFQTLGYTNVNAQRKPWGEGPYGREKQDMAVHLPARNFLSTNDTAQLLQEIALGRWISPACSSEMLALMERDLTKSPNLSTEEEGLNFTGPALSPGMKLWSKAGWVSWARHDAALIGLPDGGRIIIVTFTEGREHAGNRAIIPAVARHLLADLPPITP